MIRCYYHQWKISSAVEEGGVLPPGTRAHLQSCRPCRDFHQTQLDLVRRLANEAAAQRVVEPPRLQDRILARIYDADLTAGTPATARRRLDPVQSARTMPWPASILRPVALGGGALAIAALLFAWMKWPPHPAVPSQPSASVVNASQALRLTLAPLSAQPSLTGNERLAEWSQLLESPLESEMESVKRDARNALHFLAQNFVPEPWNAALQGELPN